MKGALVASNIVLADAQGTPVNHTFIPVGRDKNDVFWFEDQSQANAIGFWKISVELTKPPVPTAQQNSSGRTVRAKVGLHEPILETVSNNTVSGIAPAPTVSYVPRVITEFIMPERSALLDRKNLRKMKALLLADAQIVNLVENLVYIQ
jgi:hypothetical protein